MTLSRRRFLAGAGIVSSAVVTSCGFRKAEPVTTAAMPAAGDWEGVRRQFPDLAPELIHLSALFIASHPLPVQQAIDRHRRELDRMPVEYLLSEVDRQERRALDAAARYLETEPAQVALTDSTTMGVGLMYNGLLLRPGQEILTTEHDYYVTHESARLAADRAGASVREIRLFEESFGVTEEQIVAGIVGAIGPATRVLGLTWVQSGTGLKLPLGRIAEALRPVNDARSEDDGVLLFVDGVHGFGVEDVAVDALGCDAFAAGCHKWLFGPRGTGILWCSPRVLAASRPTIPSFMDDGRRLAWMKDVEPSSARTGRTMTPGGFKAYEHRWALSEAFALHERLGKAAVATRTHELARQLKMGLAGMRHVRLHTPMADALSSGIVCFDVEGMSADDTVDALRERRVVATVTPYATPHARLAPSIRNTPGEVEQALAAIRELD